MYACMYVCMYVCTYVCMYVCMYVCIYVCMYACMYVSGSFLLYTSNSYLLALGFASLIESICYHAETAPPLENYSHLLDQEGKWPLLSSCSSDSAAQHLQKQWKFWTKCPQCLYCHWQVGRVHVAIFSFNPAKAGIVLALPQWWPLGCNGICAFSLPYSVSTNTFYLPLDAQLCPLYFHLVYGRALSRKIVRRQIHTFIYNLVVYKERYPLNTRYIRLRNPIHTFRLLPYQGIYRFPIRGIELCRALIV